jgi:hypothetical protein
LFLLLLQLLLLLKLQLLLLLMLLLLLFRGSRRRRWGSLLLLPFTPFANSSGSSVGLAPPGHWCHHRWCRCRSSTGFFFSFSRLLSSGHYERWADLGAVVQQLLLEQHQRTRH